MAGNELQLYVEVANMSDSDDEAEGNVWLIHPDNRDEPAGRCGHVAVRMEKYLVVFGGYSCRPILHPILLHQEEYLSNSHIWMYHLEQEHWTMMRIAGKKRPPGTSGAVAAVIGNDIYMQGGHTAQGNTNSIWTLTKKGQNITWKQIEIGNQTKTPSPRDKHACWEHDEKLWIFGGYGPPPPGYLNEFGRFFTEDQSPPQRGWNNQLHCFDPSLREWRNVESLGAVPSPRAAHAACKSNDKVLLFGGRSGPLRLDDCFELNMCSLQWSLLQTAGPEKPMGRSWHSFTVIKENHVMLHGGYSTDETVLCDTWILDVGSGCTWHPYTATQDHPRLWHTATTGLNSSVVVFGGCQTNIFSDSIAQQMCNDLFRVALEPESLLQQAMKVVYRHRRVLQSEWEFLPLHLYHQLLNMCKHDNSPDDGMEQPNPNLEQGVAKSCTIA